jgi:hypothetical protein
MTGREPCLNPGQRKVENGPDFPHVDVWRGGDPGFSQQGSISLSSLKEKRPLSLRLLQSRKVTQASLDWSLQGKGLGFYLTDPGAPGGEDESEALQKGCWK